MFREEIFSEEIQTLEQEDYTTERNKPMPNRIHGTLQSAASRLLYNRYGDRYSFPSEVTLDTQPRSSAPDILVYPKKRLSLSDAEAKEKEMPLTTIEIQSPSQSPEELIEKARELYFPAGVKSAWVVIPAAMSIRVILPDNRSFLFTLSDELHDPVTDIRLPVEKVFEDIDW
ncbi:MAG: Uma2 family endonuclease [Bacteroidota bacterium]